MIKLNKKHLIILSVILALLLTAALLFVFSTVNSTPRIEVTTQSTEKDANIDDSSVENELLTSISQSDLNAINVQMVQFVASSTNAKVENIKGEYRQKTLMTTKNQYGAYMSYIIDFPEQKISYKAIIPSTDDYSGVSIVCVEANEIRYEQDKCKDSFSE